MVARAGVLPSNGVMLLGMLLFVLPSVRKHRTRVVVVQTHTRTGALLLGMLDHPSLSLPSVRKHQTRVVMVVVVQTRTRTGALLLGSCWIIIHCLSHLSESLEQGWWWCRPAPELELCCYLTLQFLLILKALFECIMQGWWPGLEFFPAMG